MNIRNSIMMQDKVSPVLKGIRTSAVQARASLAQIGGPVSIAVNSSGAISAIGAAKSSNDRFIGSFDRAKSKSDIVSSSLAKWAVGIGAAIFGLQKVADIVTSVTDKVDAYTNMNARLNLINDGAQTTGELNDSIYAAAQRSRGNYFDMGQIVGKMGILAGEAFSDNQELVGFTELMQKSFRVGGASTQEQQAGMYQLTQAMAAGKLQGDEFRSIMENAPMLAQAIADFTGKSKGELKEMSAEGTITADIIKGAMFAAGNDINEMFESMPMTFGDIKNQFNNMVTKGLEPAMQRMGKLANSEKFQTFMYNMANAITVLGNAAVGVLDVVASAANFAAEHWAVIGPILLFTAGAMGVLITATLTMKTAQWLLNAAMAACPLTWIVIGFIAVIAVISWVINKTNELGITNISVIGSILAVLAGAATIAWNILASILNIGLGVTNGLWNAFAALANFCANCLRDFGGAAANLLADMGNSALSMIQGVAKAVDTLLGTNTAGAIGKLQSKLTSWAQTKTNGEYKKVVPTADFSLPTFNAFDNAKKAYKWGKGLPDKVKQVLEGDSLGFDSTPLGLGNNSVANVDNVDTVDKINNSVNIADESLRYLSDAMVRSYVNNINVNTVQPNFKVEFTGDIRENADADVVAEQIIAKAKEKMYSGADLAYDF